MDIEPQDRLHVILDALDLLGATVKEDTDYKPWEGYAYEGDEALATREGYMTILEEAGQQFTAELEAL